jgi:hypothetical protein
VKTFSSRDASEAPSVDYKTYHILALSKSKEKSLRVPSRDVPNQIAHSDAKGPFSTRSRLNCAQRRHCGSLSEVFGIQFMHRNATKFCIIVDW